MITIEVPQSSSADEFLRRWARYLKNADSWLFALSALNIVDAAGPWLSQLEMVMDSG